MALARLYDISVIVEVVEGGREEVEHRREIFRIPVSIWDDRQLAVCAAARLALQELVMEEEYDG